MASNREQFEDISERLLTVERELEIRPKPQSWWRSRYEWVINHKGTSLCLAIVLCVIGIFGGGYFKYWLDHKDDGVTRIADDEIRKNVTPTLTNIDHNVTELQAKLNTLLPFIQEVVRHQFENVASLPTALLGDRLPAIEHLASVARSEEVQIKPAIVNRVADNLLALQPRPPSFWPTASELINYRSFLSAPQQYLNATIKMRNCDIHPGRDLTIHSGDETTVVRNALSITQQNCFLDLDEHRQIEAYYCQQCVVKYSGGPLTLIAPVRFENCLFVFSIRSEPPTQSGRDLTEKLLAENPHDVTIPKV